MTQTEFMMTCRSNTKDFQINQTDDSAAKAKLNDLCYLAFEKVWKSEPGDVVLHVGTKRFLVQKTAELREIIRIYQECKEKKTDLTMALTEFGAKKLFQFK